MRKDFGNMKKELEKNFNPAEAEDRIYAQWEKKGYFHAEVDEKKEPFTIVIPPPNVTGQLHMGHALDETLQDILIRARRMQGYNALWIPGTDHAGIATQIKVEETLRKEEGLTRYDLGREKFLERVWDWKDKYGNRIIRQIKKLGCSCDWERERFTMDEGLSAAVRHTFCNLYNKGLIYRGYRIINWCTSCRTALSDAEVEYKEDEGFFWHIRYYFEDSSDYIVIATTRPETLLGDTAVAVHPEDERYKDLVGKNLILPLVGRKIPIVADEYVDKEFGTGCVKITPGHDPNDFEVGQRHGLETIIVLSGDGKINSNGGKYEGMDRYEARKAIIKDLEDGGFLVKTEKHMHNVGHCYRCGSSVEPMASDQWFVKMKPLAGPAIDAVKDGDINFVPDRFGKSYTYWMENIRDWCISRQLWWGHQIPAFYCDECGEMTVSEEDITTCPKCGAKVRRESDVLDTWFSSALWPFSTLGWPEETEELKYFYPTSVLVTGYDIIPFWVARMIFSGLEQTGKKPFSHVFIHGLVRDEQGRKMSKSLGNGIDPLEIISKYGADTLRFALSTGNSPGNDMRFSDKKVEAARNFCNKVWNAARFVLMNLETEDYTLPEASELLPEDKWIVTKLNELVSEVTRAIDRFDIGIALSKIYGFLWDWYCDWYIELVKPRLYNKDNETKITAERTLAYVLINALKLLHPFMPFVTEEIYQSLMGEDESIMVSDWPVYSPSLNFEKESRETELVIGAIKAVRNLRTDMNVPPSRKAKIIIVSDDTEPFKAGEAFFVKLASASSVEFKETEEGISENAVSQVTEGAKIIIPLDELVDRDKEIERLTGEKERLISEIERVEKLLAYEGYLKKAPAALVEKERAKGESFRKMLTDVESGLKKYM